ncbi:MAG: hypothetical protein J5950_05385 [Clostridia bacterium]|nr:hypothetical protein [Clostridia bacterium]
MKNAVKIIALLIAAVLALSHCACAKKASPADGKRTDPNGSKVTDKPAGTDGNANVTAGPSVTDAPETGAPEPTQVPEELSYKIVDDIKKAAAGDVIIFGTYEQDGDTSNGKEPLEWLVLEKSGNAILVITLYAVESKVFNDSRDYITWETSTMRAWLNDDFYRETFSPDESAKIKNTTLVAEKNPQNENVSPGNDTEDKIFLLSIQEAEKYFKDNSERKCSPSEALVATGGFTVSSRPWYASHSYACLWWLRSPGMDKLKIAYVDKGGAISYSGNQVDYNNNTCVRPAMWVVIE